MSRSYINRIKDIFQKFEYLISIIMAVLIGGLVVVATVRIIVFTYNMVFSKAFFPTSIKFEDFNELFGMIMTLLIIIEFMNSILSVLRSRELKGIVKDVSLITGLAIARKLIILDYTQTEPLTVLAMSGVLVAVGVFYFLVKVETISKLTSNRQKKEIAWKQTAVSNRQNTDIYAFPNCADGIKPRVGEEAYLTSVFFIEMSENNNWYIV